MNNLQVVPGSLQAEASKGKSLAEVYSQTKLVILSDNSDSMAELDGINSHNKHSARYEVRDEVLKKFESQYPGKIALLSFASEAHPCPGGLQDSPRGGTRFVTAFDLLDQLYIDGQRVLLISDGEAFDNVDEMSRRAKRYSGKIDFAFAGSIRDEDGKKYLMALAKATGGNFYQNVFQVANQHLALENRVNQLLLT